MRISKRLTLAAGVLALLALPLASAAPAERTAAAAYNAARTALMARDYARAVPDLKFAADRGVFIAQYYLARLYAMNGQPFTDHRASFEMFRRLVAVYRGVDPYLDSRAPFVAKSELLLALSYRDGLPEANVSADLAKAKAHLEHAALRLADTDAQYELGVMDLDNPDTVARGLDTLDDLAEHGRHAAAAAQIALVYSQGRYSQKDLYQALAYATLAVSLAGDADRIWISDVYQSIYCQTRAADRERAKDFARELEHGANAAAESDDQPSRIGTNRGRVHGVLDLADVGALRVCNNGDVVPDDGPASGRTLLLPARPERDADASASAPRSGAGSIGPPMGIGLKDLETPEPLNGDEAAPTDDGQAPTE